MTPDELIAALPNPDGLPLLLSASERLSATHTALLATGYAYAEANARCERRVGQLVVSAGTREDHAARFAALEALEAAQEAHFAAKVKLTCAALTLYADVTSGRR